MGGTNFFRHFAIPELKSISGKWYRNIFTLVLILLVALLAIGVGKVTTSYLKLKMDNPFIKFINVTFPHGHKGVDINDFKNVDLRERFDYGEVNPVYINYMDFKGTNGKDYNATARMISTNNEFYKFISNNNDILLTSNSFNDQTWGCIITEGYLKKLGYKGNNISYINYINPIGGIDQIIPIPVCAVVTQLPDYTDILISQKLYNATLERDQLDITNAVHKDYLKFFLQGVTALPEEFSKNGYTVVPVNESHVDGLTVLKTNISDTATEIQAATLPKVDYKLFRLFDYDRAPAMNNLATNSTSGLDNISFSFNKLDSIRAFQQYLLDRHKLKIDMNVVEAKENFNFFDKLAKLLSSSLVIFSIFIIVTFITNITLSHIERNKKNLGTLKAFGLSNVYIIALYTGISVTLIVLAFLLSFILSYLIGDVGVNLLLSIFNIDNSQSQILYDNYPWYYLVIVFLILPVTIIFIKLWTSLNKKTPGDLIYERD